MINVPDSMIDRWRRVVAALVTGRRGVLLNVRPYRNSGGLSRSRRGPGADESSRSVGSKSILDDGSEPTSSSRPRLSEDARPRRLNLGCGEDYRKYWHNVDLRDDVDPDEVVDLDETPWPWDDGSFDAVLMSNVLEHLDDQHGALHELHRITAPGGRIEVRVPHPNSPGFWADPTHSFPVSEQTFTHDLAPDWVVEDVEVSRVRFGRLVPESIALRLADHLGHVVDEITVYLRRDQ